MDSNTCFKFLPEAGIVPEPFVKEMLPILESKLNYDGISLCQNNGFVQEVKHFHLHLIPNYKNSKKLSVEEVYKIICEN